MAPSPSSSATTSVQVALRIRPTTSQDAISIPVRFQRPVIHAASSNTVSVDSTSGPLQQGSSNAVPSATSASVAKRQVFTFDQVHPPTTAQHSIYTATAAPLISRFVEGFNCTVLAYGQTSSGKTFTMTGVDLDQDPTDPDNNMGIIPRSVAAIFSRCRQLKEERAGAWNFSIKGSFIELYNEDLLDLLSDVDGRREVQIREDKDGNIIWGGLREVSVRNAGEVMSLVRQGTAIRRTNETDMNAQSSRSHAIFSLTLTQKKYVGSGPPPRASSPQPGTRPASRLMRPGSVAAVRPGSVALSPTRPASVSQRVGSPTFGRPPTPSFTSAMNRGGLRPSSALGYNERASEEDRGAGDWISITSKFHFVDLAGSERLKRTGGVGERVKEGISINSGLLALGNVISALGDPARVKSHTHVPYRDSKLTRLLQDSLGGNAHTLMIACISAAEWNVAETVNTLKYANRARNIKNRAVVNEREEGWDDMEWLQGTVTRLRRELKALKDGGAGGSATTVGPAPEVEGAGKKVLAQMADLQNNYEDLREKFVERTEELTRLRRELGERTRTGTNGATGGTAKYEEIVGPVIEEYEKTISAMEAELSLNRAALRHTNEMVEEKEEELNVLAERHAVTELYVEELRSRVTKLSEREASTEAYVRDLEEKIKAYDETSITSSESMTDLKREVLRYKEVESHSAKYIAELEARLARSDESVLELQQAVERLEQDCERRQEEVETLQARLDQFKSDGESWRLDLEQRERRLADLEAREKLLQEIEGGSKMQDWEKKLQAAAEARMRLGNVVTKVEGARRSLEVDTKRSSANGDDSPTVADVDTPSDNHSSAPVSTTGQQLLDLQQTHTATLADLSNITAKYRDALREISDLAAQIQEAKLAEAGVSESDSAADRSPESSGRRRRIEPSYSASGRRLFFRQAASTESLHASISVPSMSHSRSTSSITEALRSATMEQRTVQSLEKEIMRLQEVLKERESEIEVLEESMKKHTNGYGNALDSPIPESPTEPHANGSMVNDVFLSPKTMTQFDYIRKTMQNGHIAAVREEPPDTAAAYAERDESLARLNELMLSMAQKESSHRDIVDDLSAQLATVRRQLDDLTTLNRDQAMNMAREIDSLQKKRATDLEELEQLQKREMELIQQLEAAEAEHTRTVERLRAEHEDALRAKSVEIEDLIARVKQEHEEELAVAVASSENISKLCEEQAAALKASGDETADLVGRLQEEHEQTLSGLRRELAAATSQLEKSRVEHEEAFGTIKAEHAATLRRCVDDANELLAKTRSEHEKAVAQLIAEHAEVLTKRDADHISTLQRTEEEYYNALTKLRSDQAAALEQQSVETAATVERLKNEHADQLRMAEIAREGSLSASESARSIALQELQDAHATAALRKEASFKEEIEQLRTDHARALTTKEEDHALELDRTRAEHESLLTRMKEEWRVESNRLQALISAGLQDAQDATDIARKELESTTRALNEQHAAHLQDVERGHQSKVEELIQAREAALQEAQTLFDAEKKSLLDAHAQELSALMAQHADAVRVLQEEAVVRSEEMTKLKIELDHSVEEQLASAQSHSEVVVRQRAEHEKVIQEMNNSMVASQEEHLAALEEARAASGRIVEEERARMTATLESLREDHAAERHALTKDRDFLAQELESCKQALEALKVSSDSSSAELKASQQAHEEMLAERNALLAEKETVLEEMSEELSAVTAQRDDLEAEVARLRGELDKTFKEQSKLIQEASKRQSLVDELERHRSVLAELQEDLQRVKDEKDVLQTERDALQSEKTRSETVLREMQAQLALSSSPLISGARVVTISRPGLPPMKLPPTVPPPSVPPPSAPRAVASNEISQSVSSVSSSGVGSNSSHESHADTPATSIASSASPAHVANDHKLVVKIEQQTKLIEEQEVMIKTLNKQLTHCESDLQTHMDLVTTLETSLGDSEKNLRKARMHATELARERDTLLAKCEALRTEVADAKKEVQNVRRSIVEEKQSLEQRLDEERRAKERARQQLDSRMEEIQKRKSKFACL
ncbi:kinesin-domain-containing protein [Fistulina hepatica ATCC 64428]|uniref:Kinesin-domain-containing protein n=1 Tax=Fistulina hepatica ATCC 64428 TaxID=1128425 RepID=A0A0D7A1Y1_9AGAR|nr:kinesin-domain-containing protein [Fistulina hepatica ATCC 64428]